MRGGGGKQNQTRELMVKFSLSAEPLCPQGINEGAPP